ncbi:MAG: hypothetical protein GYA21_00910 [Myxococcales bacterium]|nr:hypothetical protein [Myxococcales bacterium]
MSPEAEKKKLALFTPDRGAEKKLSDLLGRLGYQVYTSHRFEDLERLLSRPAPGDLVLCDSALFGPGYREVQEKLARLLKACREPPLLLLCALHLSLEAKDKLLALGCADVLSLEAPFLELVFAINRILFPKIRELRRYTRVFGGFPVDFKSDKASGRGEVYNISQEGAFIQCERPESEGTRLTVRFDLPGTDEPLQVEAVVSWRTERSGDFSPTGMGVSFLALGEGPSQSLGRFISGRANGNR